MGFIVGFTNPFKSLNLIRDYFEVIRVIQSHKSVRLCEENLSENDSSSDYNETILYEKIVKRRRLADILITLKLVHFLLLWLYSTSPDPVTAILNIDLINLCHLDNALQIQGFLFIGSINFYYGRMLFVNFHPFILKYYKSFIFHGKLDNVFLTPLVYRGVSIRKRIQKNAFYTILGMRLFVLVIHVILLGLQVSGLVLIVSHGEYFAHWHNPLTGWPINRYCAITVTLIYFEFFWTLMAFTGYCICYIGILLLAVISIGMTGGFIMFAQTLEWCRKICLARAWLSTRLLAMLRHNRRLLIVVLHQTTYYSNALLVFMSINIPFNCHILGTILFGKPNPTWIPIMILFMAQQWIVIFGCHILCVRINQAPFESNKLLLHLSARRRLPPRATLTLAIYLQTFHTKKGYGIRYGKLGLITMGTFGKFLLLYCEFIMYACMIVTS